MSEQAFWSLLYKEENGARTFLEFRRSGPVLWSATGACSTFGESKTVAFESADAAAAAHRKSVDDAQGAGFTVARARTYDPRTFDYTALQSEVEAAATKGFSALCAANAGTHLNGFALLTDGDAMTLSWSAAALDANAAEDDRFDPFEWPITGFEDEVDIAYRMILSKARDIPFEWVDGMPPEALHDRMHHGSPEGWSHRDGVLEVFVRALAALRSNGVFGRGEFLLLVMPSDSEQIRGMAERLNAPLIARKFARWIGSDSLRDLQPPTW